MISLLFIIIALIYIWNETDAPIEYFRLLRLKFTKYKEYDKFRETNPSISYLNFLLLQYPSFWTRLLECPVCLIVWANFILILCNLRYWDMVGINMVFCWLVYSGLKWSLKKIDE